MTTQKATATQVRAHYIRDGFEVRINMKGHVEYRENGGEWLEGRYVSEYRVIDGQVVLT